MTDYLECPICGGVAAWADADGMFTDGTDSECEDCHTTGSVACDEETEAYWRPDE